MTIRCANSLMSLLEVLDLASWAASMSTWFAVTTMCAISASSGGAGAVCAAGAPAGLVSADEGECRGGGERTREWKSAMGRGHGLPPVGSVYAVLHPTDAGDKALVTETH